MSTRNMFFNTRFRKSELSETQVKAGSVEIQRATLTDGRLKILNGLDLKVEPGSKTCLVGTTGRDQASLFSAINGLTTLDSGTVSVQGRVGLVLNNPWISNRSLAENISFDRNVDLNVVRQACSLVKLTKLIRALPQGLETQVANPDSYVTTDGQTTHDNNDQITFDDAGQLCLNLLQRRQVALARALIANPSLLLIDEPTQGLEFEQEQMMIDAIEAAHVGRTTIICTHRLRLARKADQVLVFEDGLLVPYNTTTRRLSPTSHARLWDLKVPGLIEAPPETASEGLRVVNPFERRSPKPDGTGQNVKIGSEISPGLTITGLLGRYKHVDIWVAWSSELKRPVKVKVPATDPLTYRTWEQMSREQKLGSKLRHPGITKTYGAELNAEMPYVVSEYVDSRSLAEAAQVTGGFEPLALLQAGYELAAAINYLHQRGFVHMNLRPTHVRTKNEGLIITDVSHIRKLDSTLLDSSFSQGTNQKLIAPELHTEAAGGHSASAAIDIYGLGALLHRLASASVRTQATPNGLRYVRFSDVYDPEYVETPPGMNEILDSMLAEDPRNRPSAEIVLGEFRQLLPRHLTVPRVSQESSYQHLTLVNKAG